MLDGWDGLGGNGILAWLVSKTFTQCLSLGWSLYSQKLLVRLGQIHYNSLSLWFKLCIHIHRGRKSNSMKVGCVKEVCLLRLSGNNCRVRSGQSGLARLQSAVAVQPRWPGCFQIRIATKLSLSLDQIEPDLMPKKMAIFGDPKFKVETTKSIY